MKKLSSVILRVIILSMLCTWPAVAQTSNSGKLPDAPVAKTQTDAGPFKDQKAKASYALGMNWGNILRRQSVDVDPDVLLQGMKDAMAGGKTLLTDDEARAVLTQLENDSRTKMEAKRKEEASANQKEGDEFLAANKAKEGVVTTASGLQYKILTAGTGPKPTTSDTVICNYKGTMINGTEFDSSAKHGGAATFPVSGVIKGWTEALPLMPVGSKWQLFVPSTLAYGPSGTRDGTIPPNTTLIFEVELLSIKPKDNPAPDKDTPPAK